MQNTSFYYLLSKNLPDRGKHLAIIDSKCSATYEMLGAEVDLLADYLIAKGVRPGDRVIVQLRKSISEVAAMLAVSKIGAVVVNVNVQWTTRQLNYVAADCQAKVLVLESNVARELAEQTLPVSILRVLVRQSAPNSEKFDSFNNLRATGDGVEVRSEETDLAMIIYTSGSTGMPKGVMLSHRNILTGAKSVIDYLKLGADDRLLSVLPYSFDAGLNQLTTMMMTGGTIVHQPIAMPMELVRTVREHRVTGFAGVPPLWNGLVRLLDANPVEMPTLRLITNTGGKIPLNILERMPDLFPGVDIYLMYGLTEAFRSTYLPPEKFAHKMGSIGHAIPGADIFVIKPGGGIAGPGEQGELVHHGPLVCLGYWQRPDLTQEKIRPCLDLSHIIGDAPVVYSGDIVRVDKDGDLWFVGRNDDMIKTSGFRLSPTEVEELVSRSGFVGDVVAFGVEDDEMGQVVHLAINPLSDFDETTFQKYCRQTMPHYMIPRQIHIWPDAMPRTASGKLDRPKIIETCKSNLNLSQSDTPSTAETADESNRIPANGLPKRRTGRRRSA